MPQGFGICTQICGLFAQYKPVCTYWINVFEHLIQMDKKLFVVSGFLRKLPSIPMVFLSPVYPVYS
jgi:hypothetical protein